MRDLIGFYATSLFIFAAGAMVLTTPGQMMIIQFLENIRL
jgi:hypothetical protein